LRSVVLSCLALSRLIFSCECNNFLQKLNAWTSQMQSEVIVLAWPFLSYLCFILSFICHVLSCLALS
jgi:hypothetical protein